MSLTITPEMNIVGAGMLIIISMYAVIKAIESWEKKRSEKAGNKDNGKYVKIP